MSCLIDEVSVFRESLYQCLVAEARRVQEASVHREFSARELALVAHCRVMAAAGCGSVEVSKALAIDLRQAPNERAEP